MKCALAIPGLFLLSTALSVLADDWPQWRGPQRNGISRETGLLKEWPKEGPKLVWKIAEAGRGYSTPAVAGDRLYLLGNEGLEDEFVEALAVKDGKRVWRTRLGNVGNFMFFQLHIVQLNYIWLLRNRFRRVWTAFLLR